LSQALLMVAGKPKMPEGSAVGAQLVSRHLLRRTMLYEAAHSLLIHSGKWSWLKAWGVRVAQRRGMTSSDRRGRQTSGRGSAPDVGRWSRVPLEQGQSARFTLISMDCMGTCFPCLCSATGVRIVIR
jgi:hypothetical protein